MAVVAWDGSCSELPLAASAVWRASAEERLSHAHHRRYCPTKVAPYSDSDPQACLAHQECHVAGCLDVHHELLARVLQKLAVARRSGRRIANLGGYLSKVAGTELVEWRRAQRSAAGFAARPSRSDGVPAKIIAALDAQDPSGWFSTLFRIMRSCAFGPHHIPGSWPIEGLRDELRRFLPGADDSPQRIRRDIDLVVKVATQTAGYSWVYDNVLLPINSGMCAAELAAEPSISAPVEVDQVMGTLLREAYSRARARGLSTKAALAQACLEVTGKALPALDADAKQALRDLDASVTF